MRWNLKKKNKNGNGIEDLECLPVIRLHSVVLHWQCEWHWGIKGQTLFRKLGKKIASEKTQLSYLPIKSSTTL